MLTKKQIALLEALGIASWVVERVQGTGLKFWRLTYSYGEEWRGCHYHAEGRTFRELCNSLTTKNS